MTSKKGIIIIVLSVIILTVFLIFASCGFNNPISDNDNETDSNESSSTVSKIIDIFTNDNNEPSTPTTNYYCSDTDGGRDIDNLGICTDANDNLGDMCAEYLGDVYVDEFWCDYTEDKCEVTTMQCPYGSYCESGACVERDCNFWCQHWSDDGTNYEQGDRQNDAYEKYEDAQLACMPNTIDLYYNALSVGCACWSCT